MNKSLARSKRSYGTAAGYAAAGIAAAVAGAYLLYTKNGRKYQKKFRGWILQAKGEVLEQMEKLKDLNEDKYLSIVDEVAKRYKSLKNVDPKEIETMVTELRSHWKNIKKQLAQAAR